MAKFAFSVSDADFKLPNDAVCGNNNCCVLMATKEEGVALRNSTDPTKTTIYCTHEEFKAFMDMMPRG